MNGSRSVRGFVLFLLCYGGARTAIIWAPDLHPVRLTTAAVARTATPNAAGEPSPIATGLPTLPNPGTAAPLLAPPPTRITSLMLHHVMASPVMTAPASSSLRRAAAGKASQFAILASPTGTVSGKDRNPVPPSPSRTVPSQAPSLLPAATAPASRWSGYAYLFHRPDRAGPATLAPAGQIGGSQAAARIAYRLPHTPIALAARIATPLRDTRQAEVAAGLDLLPVPNLRISVERRIAIGRDGRDAFAAYAAGGLFRAIATRLELDGYAQAGFVGIERRDPFADGALRIHHRTAIGATTDLRLGAGAWGAAQPGASRLGHRPAPRGHRPHRPPARHARGRGAVPRRRSRPSRQRHRAHARQRFLTCSSNHAIEDA